MLLRAQAHTHRRQSKPNHFSLNLVRAEMEAQRAKEQHELKNALAEREAMIAALQKELERQKAPPEA